MADATLRLLWTTLTDFVDRFDEFFEDLPAEEKVRAERFRIESARRRFVLARTLLRHEVATIVGIDPSEIGFEIGGHGKPQLAKTALETPPHFNLSHSGDLVVLAIAETDVGADVESIRPVPNAEKLAHRFFSPAERLAVYALDGGARDRAFLRIWTQKEAYLKATGLGVGMPLRVVETEPDPGAPPRLIAIGGDQTEAARWELKEIELPGAVCTVASLGPISEVEVVRRTLADFGQT